MSLLLVSLFVITLFIGVPVAVSMGMSAAVVILVYDLPISVLAQRSLNALNSTPLLAVPLFILAANILNASGVTGHIFELVRLFVGRIRGGIAQVTVLVSLIFFRHFRSGPGRYRCPWQDADRHDAGSGVQG